MITKQPEKSDENMVYELYYLHNVRFAELDDTPPKRLIYEDRREQNRAIKRMMFAKSRNTGRIR